MKLRKRLMLYTLLGCMLLPANVMASSVTVYAAVVESEEVTPQADSIDWQYKVIDGALYKRLYNYTTNTPLSDWQIVT